MSNYTALARLKGSAGNYREAVFIDGYFGGRNYGVRFRGSTTFHRAEDVELLETTTRKAPASRWQKRR